MIPAFRAPWEPDLWKALLRDSVRSSDALLQSLDLKHPAAEASPDFPVRVPPPYLSRIRPGDPEDPLLLQVLAQAAEAEEIPGFTEDALAESQAVRSPGLLQKYEGRALVIVTPACAIHCRYCFRRHFPYEDHSPAEHPASLATLAADPSVEEVILSGGDPLIADDAVLARLLEMLSEIPHVRRIRLHTRMPVVLPQRVTADLLKALGDSPKQIITVIHANHAQELDPATHRALSLLAGAGVTLLNQSVLLKQVNDSWQAQKALAEALFEQGVLPYYLHLLDRVSGTHHFEVSEEEASSIMTELHARLPGYLVPTLAKEIPGESGKTPIYWTTRPAKTL